MATETTTDVTPRGENLYLHALLGAVVTVVTTVVPFSPLLGGFVAGYLQDAGTDRGTRVGALAGVFASLPLALVFFFVLTVMSVGSLTTGEVAGPAFVLLLVGGILVFAALYIVGLSAVGGYLGASYAESRAERRAAADDTRQTTLGETAPATDDGR